MAITTERNPEWINWIAPNSFEDKDLFRIVIFFVFHSPCENLSSMRRTLAEYGWSAPWKKPYYLNKQLRQVASRAIHANNETVDTGGIIERRGDKNAQ